MLGYSLELAFSALRAGKALVRMVAEHELDDGLTGSDYPDGAGLNLHSFSAGGAAGRGEVSPAFHFYNAYAAGCRMVVCAGSLEVHVAKGRDDDSYALGRVKYRSALRNNYFMIINNQ